MATPRILRSSTLFQAVVPLVVLLLGVALTTGCACTRPDCQFGITSPKSGETLPPGDVDLKLNPLVRQGLCGFPAHSYDVWLDDQGAQKIPRGDAPSFRFPGVGPGSHTAHARALDSLGKPLAEAQVTFNVEAPAPPPPPPPPTPTAAPAPAAPPEEPLDTLSGYLKDVFFDFDRYEIRPDQRDTLSANGDWLKEHAAYKVTIEGHCDERGTREYNMALGERRAHAAKEYLTSLGVDEARLTTVSYGKDRPFAEGHDEEAWAKNRRAHFIVTGK